MKARRIVVLLAVGLAYGCGGGNSSPLLEPQDGSTDGAVPDTGSTLPDGGGMLPDDGAAASDATAGDDGSDTGMPSEAAAVDAAEVSDAAPSADALDDGPAFDGNLVCSGTNSACSYGIDAGLPADGLCASNACGPCVTATDDGLCQAAYGGDAGAHYICANAACVSGNCHSDTDCSGETPACVNNVCTACDGASNGVYYVDPNNGSDSVNATGSDTAGGRIAAMCAFKTITHALSVVGAPSASTKIVVLGPATVSVGETFPLSVPQNVVIEGQGTVTVDVPAATTSEAGVAAANGFMLAHPASGLETLTISGQSLTGAAGVLVQSGSATSTYLKNVVIEKFSAGSGVHVTGSGVVVLQEGVVATENKNGLVLGDTATATASNSNQSNPVLFSQNTQDGILVTGSASLSFAGDAGSMGAGSIVVSQNGSGIVFTQVGPGVNMPPSTLTGVVAWKNTLYGLDLQGGSRAVLRSSFVGANAIGVSVRTSTVSSSNDTSYIDLGTAAEPGQNTLQSLASSDAGPSAQNTAAAVCYAILPNSSQTLSAEGNVWTNAIGNAAIDCSGTSPGQLSSGAVCTGAVDVAGSGVQLVGGAGKNTVDVNHCSL